MGLVDAVPPIRNLQEKNCARGRLRTLFSTRLVDGGDAVRLRENSRVFFLTRWNNFSCAVAEGRVLGVGSFRNVLASVTCFVSTPSVNFD